MSLGRMLLPAVMCVLFFSCSIFKKNSTKVGNITKEQAGVTKTDTISKTKEAGKEGKPKPYKEVITAKAITDAGLFTVHRIDDHYFFELPDSLLGQDILIVSRIARGAAGVRPSSLGYAGDQIGEKVIRFVKGPADKLFIKTVSFSERSVDSSENGMYRSVYNSTLQPISYVFDIKAYTSDSTGSVIDVTDFIKSDNSLLYFDPELKKTFVLGGWQKDKSYIEDVKSFPVNLELQVVNTYIAGDGTVTYELNTSFVLLPRAPMQPRYYDERVGYFGQEYLDFDAPKGVAVATMIIRWRLEPKEEDREKYLRGELVEPKKPIVYYIDPTTPKKWVPYLIQGVNDWQKAFEKAGFKNAIYALEAPSNDSTFSLLDARHNAIIYKPSVIPNANGPNVHDPRTGEILESHINWYHNVMSIIHDWYMIQAGPNDPRAQKPVFDDNLMGQLIRFVSSHEVGHTLGLLHNFLASSLIPVDSLRSKTYVEANGFCPSIMDYARFNYVAQPEDSIPQRSLMPRIGVYDEWAIEWGYRWLLPFKTKNDEKVYMNNWIIDRLGKDKRLQFATAGFLGSSDPRVRTEDLGDDAMKAGYYGIQNLKRIMPHILEWTNASGTNYAAATKMQTDLIFKQYYAYISHVLSNIAGLQNNNVTREQKGKVYEFTNREKQRAAIRFLQNQLFTTPIWFIDSSIYPYTGARAAGGIRSIQIAVLYDLLSYSNFDNMLLAEKMDPGKAYSFTDMLDDLEAGIWKELDTKSAIDTYRRDLQKAYAERLISLLVFNKYTSVTSYNGGGFETRVMTDFYSIAKAHIRKLLAKLNKALPAYKEDLTKWHLVDLKERLQRALEPSDMTPSNVPAIGSTATPTLRELLNDKKFDLNEFNY